RALRARRPLLARAGAVAEVVVAARRLGLERALAVRVGPALDRAADAVDPLSLRRRRARLAEAVARRVAAHPVDAREAVRAVARPVAFLARRAPGGARRRRAAAVDVGLAAVLRPRVAVQVGVEAQVVDVPARLALSRARERAAAADELRHHAVAAARLREG